MRICFAGTFNSGKTTAFNKCKESLKGEGYHFLSERSRFYHSKGTPINEGGSLESQELFLEELFTFLVEHPNAVCEDSPFTILAYTKLFHAPSMDVRHALSRFSRLIDRIVLFSPFQPITDDGVRITDENAQIMIQGFIQGMLSQSTVPVVRFGDYITTLHQL